MNVSVERLRIWLLVGAGLLVAVIAAFLGYAHYRAHRFLTGLPGKLGADIQQETNGFTYSQSVKGRTIYTIHAAKALKRKDGKVTLEDVGIVLYGHGDGSTDRVDRIYGKLFEYDQGAGMVRAMGEVHIDLQAPAPTDAKARTDYAKGKDANASSHDDERLIHVKTSGLVFLQKLGVAATDQDLEFEFNGMTGHAHGADYSSDTGMLVLQSAVKVNGLKDGRPTVLTASRAELDRQKQQVTLSHATYTVVEGDGVARIAKGERVTAWLRHEGSVERAQAEGGVSLTDAGGTVTAQRGEVHLGEANQPQAANLTGEVKFVSDEPLRKAQGSADAGRAVFSKAGLLEQVVMTGAVHIQERTLSTPPAQASAQNSWNERELVAKSLELAVTSGADKKLQLREAKATGDARLTVVNPPAEGAKAGHRGATSSALAGDVLTASFVVRAGATHVKDVHGAGHTTLWRVSDTGAVQTSAGDTMDASFRSGKIIRAAKTGKENFTGADEIATAAQQGHVVMTNLPVAKPGAASAGATSEQKAVAERASYDGSTGRVTLTGSVQVSDAASVVWADRVVMEQQTGDAMAEGSVKASYQQATPSAQQPGQPSETVHVLAARGEFKHDAGVAMFYAGAGKPARLWQGASQVEAPVLRFEQKEKRLIAKSDGPGLAVHAVFVNSASLETVGGIKKADAKPANAKRPVPIRITSHEMTYEDGARRAEFSGGVLVEDADGTMQAQRAMVFLKVATAAMAKSTGVTSPAPVQTAFLGGSVDHVIVTGRVDLAQPGRKATGEQLVYTASDGLFVLTGLPGLQPRMMDEARGAITGATLSFHAGDNSVVVSNGPEAATGQRVRTETRVKQ